MQEHSAWPAFWGCLLPKEFNLRCYHLLWFFPFQPHSIFCQLFCSVRTPLSVRTRYAYISIHVFHISRTAGL